MPKLLRRLLVAFARVTALFAVLMVAYPAWAWWNMRQLQVFCDAVPSGKPVSALIGLAEQHGYSRHWIDSGLKPKPDGTHVIFVPSAASFGETVCAIQHDGTTVKSARVRD